MEELLGACDTHNQVGMGKSINKTTDRSKQETPSYLWGLSALRCHYYGVVLLILLFASTVTGRMVQSLDRECAIMQKAKDGTVQCLDQLQDLVRYIHLDKRRQRSS
jgi:hypothetical protein